jgi:hypothetical protein
MSWYNVSLRSLTQGSSVEPTKISGHIESHALDKFRAGNGMRYYFFLLSLDVFLMYFLVFRKINSSSQVEEFVKSGSWLSFGLIVFLSWSLMLMIYRLLFDKADKLVITPEGVRAANLADQFNLTWKEITATSLEKGGRSNYLIVWTGKQQHKVLLSNLDKTPEEIGHYIEVFKKGAFNAS